MGYARGEEHAVERLDDRDVQLRLNALPEWERHGEGIRRDYRFADFRQALAFVNRVGALAEDANHHPDIELGWGRVVVFLQTHDAGGVTPLDFDLACRIDNR